MNLSDQISYIRKKVGECFVQVVADGAFPFAELETNSAVKVFKLCAEDSELRYDFLECLTAVDNQQRIQLIYQVFSTTLDHRITFKISLDRFKPVANSVLNIWAAAYYYEIEAGEMFGINFEGHPDFEDGKLKQNFLLPKDWVGAPMRKDYVFPEKFDGIEHRRAPLRKDHPRP